MKIVLIPLASLAVIGGAALLTFDRTSPPAPACVEIVKPRVEMSEQMPEPPRRFARPPAPPRPVPHPMTAPVA